MAHIPNGLFNATLAYKEYLPIDSIACSRHHDAPAKSLTEATFSNWLRRCDSATNWISEKTTLEAAQEYRIPGHDHYTPDYSFYYADESGNVFGDIIDIKGKDLSEAEEQQILAGFVTKAVCGNPYKRKRDDVPFEARSFIIINPYKIRIYDAYHCEDIEGTEAHIYRCPECDRIEILPPWRLKCTSCGHEFEKDDCYCEPADCLRAFRPKRTSTTPRAKQLKEAFAQRAKEHGLVLIDADAGEEQALIMRLEPENPDGTVYVADFAYVCEDYRVTHFGQKNEKPLKLQAQVFVFDDLDDPKNRPIVDNIMRHAVDKETAISVAVFVSNSGIEITETYQKFSPAVKRPARWYVCPACGQTYLASEAHPECPFCNGEYKAK